MRFPLFNKFQLLQKIIVSGLILAILFIPGFTAPLALLAGLIVGLLLGNPWQKHTAVASKYALQVAVVGLGFGINLYQVSETGLAGIVYTATSLAITLLLGFILGR